MQISSFITFGTMTLTGFANAFRMSVGYILHQITSGNHHDAHSPFLYSLLTEGIYAKENNTQFNVIEERRKSLLKDNTSITVTDFGAGSSINNKPVQRTAKEITSRFAKSPGFCRLLFRIVKFMKPGIIVELGTSMGLSTMYLAAGNPESKVYSLEGCPETARRAIQNFEACGYTNISCITGDFDATLDPLLKKTGKVDLLFIDGNHTYEATLRYFRMVLPWLSSKSVIIFDDINWSSGMQKAWNEIISGKEVTLSVDFYIVGLTFFDTALSKQHFKMRY